MSNEPTPFEPFEPSDGRNPDGRFARGNRGGPGNPGAKLAKQVRGRLDEALHKVCAPDRLVSAVDAILKRAEAGDVAAAKLIFDRIAGPPLDRSIVERLEALEAAQEEREAGVR